MSLIIRNKKTLNDTAIISVQYKNGNKEIETKGDFTIIRIENEVVAINIKNSEKYFEFFEGPKTITEKEINILKENGITIESKSSFKIGEILSKEIHPKSQRLFVLKVKTDKEIQIVTNAKNAEVGKKVVVAQINNVLPSGVAIVPSKVMGVESQGMLCSGEALGKEKTEGVLLISGENGNEFIL